MDEGQGVDGSSIVGRGEAPEVLELIEARLAVSAMIWRKALES
jgi:hypothetical protein